jgi:hypothetical protein
MAISSDAYYEIIGANIPRFIELALQAAGDTLTTDIKARTFPTAPGEGKDANGVAIKQGQNYSAAYAKIRSTPRSSVKQRTVKTKDGGTRLVPSNKTIARYPNAALQTAYIDLSFTGNLQKFGVVENQTVNKYVIDFSNSEYAKQASNIQKNFKQPDIFAASSVEAEKALDTFELLFFKQLDNLTAQLQ